MNRLKKIIKVSAAIILDVGISVLIIFGSYYYYKMPHSGKALNIVVENPADKLYNSISGNNFNNSLPALAPDSNTKSDTEEEQPETQDSLNIATALTENGTKWSSKFADYFTNGVVSTDTGYSSKDISVNIEQKSYGGGNNKVTYYVADIYIADISCFHTKFAKDTYGVGFTESLSSMSDKVNAVFALNGDSYSNNRHKDNGTIIRNGIVYRMKYSPYDICVLYYDGTMKTYSASEFDAEQAISDGAYQTWIFGPELLDDKGKAKTSFFTWDYIRMSHPRSAIGYYEPGHYCLVLADGRQEGYSRGMYLSELAKVFEKLGCKTAYNLDGGHCSFMTLDSQVVNQPYKPGKYISDCIYIGEAE